MAFVDVVKGLLADRPHGGDPALLAWAATQPDRNSAWASCERADWMLLGLVVSSERHAKDGPRREVARLAAALVRETLPLLPEAGSWAPIRHVIEATQAWARGDAHADPSICDAYSSDASRASIRARKEGREDLEYAASAATACGIVPTGSDPTSACEAADQAARALASASPQPFEAALVDAHRRLADVIRSLHPVSKDFFS